MPPKPLDKPFFCDRFLLCLLCTCTRRYLDTGKIMVSTADQGPARTELRTATTQIPLAQSWKIKFVFCLFGFFFFFFGCVGSLFLCEGFL